MAPAGRRSSRSGAGTADEGIPPPLSWLAKPAPEVARAGSGARRAAEVRVGKSRRALGWHSLAAAGTQPGARKRGVSCSRSPAGCNVTPTAAGGGAGRRRRETGTGETETERWRRKGRGARHRRLGSTECPPGSLGRGEERGKERQREGCGVLREVENNLRGEERNLGEAERDGYAEKDGV